MRLGRIARADNDRQVRPQFSQGAERFAAGHAGHYEVQQYGRDAVWPGFHHLHGGRPSGSFDNVVAELRQRCARRPAHHLVVVHYQDEVAIAGAVGATHVVHAGVQQGQRNGERRAAAKRSLHADVAVVALDDAIRNRHPEARAGPERLRGVERLEDAPPRLFRHAWPIVRYRQRGRRVIRGQRNRNVAAFGHRVLRIQHDVQQRLLHLGRVAFDRSGVRGVRRGDGEGAVQRRPREAQGVIDDRAQLHRPELHQAPARKRKQAARQVGRAARRILDEPKVFAFVQVQVRRALQQAGEPEDRRQQVIEVVRQVPRHQAQRFHLLALHQLRLDRTPLRNVPHQRKDRVAAAVRHRRGHHVHV